MEWSNDMKIAMSNYLFRGFKPGGHLSAMLAHDYERAFWNADIHSRTVIWATARWIAIHVPAKAKGSYEAIEHWCQSPDSRKAFYDQRSKDKMWEVLKNE
jgi:hypothetical protein